jgi:regulator of replication initiation timing
MSKARELKEAFDWGKKNDLYNLDFPEVDWLIEQAEKVERIEKENEELKRFKEIVLEENRELTSEKNTLQTINENLIEKSNRHEKALQFYANKEHYEVYENVDPTDSYVHLVDMDEGDEARKALKDGRKDVAI